MPRRVFVESTIKKKALFMSLVLYYSKSFIVSHVGMKTPVTFDLFLIIIEHKMSRHY